MRPNIDGNLSIMVETFSNITCSSKSTSAPDYYSKLVTLIYTWFVNDTEIDGETNQTLSLKVTKGVMYNKYSCAATEEDLVSDRSNTVPINPLCKAFYKLCLVKGTASNVVLYINCETELLLVYIYIYQVIFPLFLTET